MALFYYRNFPITSLVSCLGSLSGFASSEMTDFSRAFKDFITPPMKISPEEMAQNAVHFGHKVSRWNPKMKPYIYGSKRGVHIIDLEKTETQLKQAIDYLEKKANAGANILFVSTKPQTRMLLQEFHEQTGHPIVVNKWIGGMLTNFPTMRDRIKYLRSIREMISTGEIEKFTKKEQSDLVKEKEKLEHAFGGIAEMYKLPDVMFVIDGNRDESALKEANKLGIPVIGLADTNVDPEYYDLLIPANDDAISSLTYLLSFLFEAIKNGKSKKKEQKSAENQKKEKKAAEENAS